MMRFAITACDLYKDVFEAFVLQGWQPVKLFTWPMKYQTYCTSNRNIIDRAHQIKIPIQLSRMTERDMQELAQQGCDILIGAGYSWRIGDWRPYLPYAMNFHPSPLPEARGPYPTERALMEGRTEWAVTCHKFDNDFDTGDILAQETFPLSPTDCHYSMTLKIQMANKRLAMHVARNFSELWNNAKPQGEGSYWKASTDKDRTIDFSSSVETILRQVSAFGPQEAIAKTNGVTVHIRRAVGWVENHSCKPGEVVHVNNRNLVVAAADGYIGLIEWSFIDPVSFVESGR